MMLRPQFLSITAVLLSLPLAGLAYLGSFTRFYADDFCMASDAVQMGLAGMLVKWYSNWTGNFSFILSTGLFGLGGPGFARWLPAIIAGIWLAGLYWAFSPLMLKAGWPRPRLMSILAAELTLLILLSSTPNLFQSFFWQDGMVNYTLPLIGITFITGIVLRTWLEKCALPLGMLSVLLLAFLSGGFSETFSAMQVTLYLILIGITLFLAGEYHRRRLVPVLIAALTGGLLAMAVIILAPGNIIRQEATGSVPSGLFRAITFSVRNAAFIIGHFIIWNPGWALLSVTAPFLASLLACLNHPATPIRLNLRFLWAQTWFRGILFVLLAIFGLITAACAPAAYALNAFPDERVIIVPQFMLVLAAMTAGALAGIGLGRSRNLQIAIRKFTIRQSLEFGLTVILLLSIGISTWQTISKIPDYQINAQAWDQRAELIQQAEKSGATELTVVGLNARFGVSDLNADPNYWVNKCMAVYYRLINIRGK